MTLTATVVMPAGAGAEDGFVNGEAEASAETFTLNIKQGNANIGFTYGMAMSGYRDETSSAEAHALELGVLPTLFAVDQCDGSTPPMNPDTLPPKTRVDSTEIGAAASRRVQVFVPGTDGGPHGPPAGFQDAVATPKPWARGTTESVETDIYLLALDGGRTQVTAQRDGRVREAHAVSTADELRVFGELFVFTQPRWEAVARSGDVTTNEGSFTFESATVMGVERTHDEAMRDFREFKKALEWLLKPFGVELKMPEVVVGEGRVQVTPMTFSLTDPPFGAKLLAPFFERIQPLREAAVRQAVEEDCRRALAITLLDVILGVAAGSGAVEVEAGGVDVFTADTDFSSDVLELPDLSLSAPPMDLGPVPLEVAPATTLAPTTVPTTTPPTSAPRRSSERDEVAYLPATPTSRMEDTDAGAAAVAVGLTTLVGALGLVLGDRLRAGRHAGARPSTEHTRSTP